MNRKIVSTAPTEYGGVQEGGVNSVNKVERDQVVDGANLTESGGGANLSEAKAEKRRVEMSGLGKADVGKEIDPAKIDVGRDDNLNGLRGWAGRRRSRRRFCDRRCDRSPRACRSHQRRRSEWRRYEGLQSEPGERRRRKSQSRRLQARREEENGASGDITRDLLTTIISKLSTAQLGSTKSPAVPRS